MAALYVVMHHSFLQVAESPANKPNVLHLFDGFYYGRYAVDLFIVLSGFCLMLPVVKHAGQLRGGALNFFKRRALRILPPYYASLVLSLLLVWTLIGQKTGTHWDASLPVTWKSVWSHLFLIHDIVGEDYTVNNPMWSIAVEWRIYFLFPLLVFLWRRFGAAIMTVLGFLIAALLVVVLRVTLARTLTAEYIALFTLGMLATTLAFSPMPRFERARRLPWGALCSGLTIATICLTLMTILDYHKPLQIPMDMVIGTWALTLLVWVSRGNNWGHSFLSSSLLVWIGTFAYSVYLAHAPLIQLLWQYPFARLQNEPLPMFLALLLVGTPIMIGLSYLFFLAFERPFLRRRALARPEALVVKTALEPAP